MTSNAIITCNAKNLFVTYISGTEVHELTNAWDFFLAFSTPYVLFVKIMQSHGLVLHKASEDENCNILTLKEPKKAVNKFMSEN